MPLPTQTQALSPVVLPRHSARGRLLRRAVALAALALFVAGMLVAAGFGELVAAAAPVVAAGAAALAAAWSLWRVRPWRIVRPVARGVARAVGTLGRGTRSLASRAVAATRTGSHEAWEFLTRPREPWRPSLPRPAERMRRSLSLAVVRTIPARQWAHRRWRSLAAAGTVKTIELARRADAAARRAARSGVPRRRPQSGS